MSKRKKSPKKLKLKLSLTQEVSALHRLSEIVCTADDFSLALQQMAEELRAITGYPVVAIEFYQEQDRTLLLKAVAGWERPREGELRIPIQETLSGTVIQTGQAFVGDISPVESNEFWKSRGIQSTASFPLIVGKRTLGVLTFAHQEHAEMDKNLQKWAFTAAAFIGVYIQPNVVQPQSTQEQLAQISLLQTTLRRIAESAREADDLDSFYAAVHHLVAELMPSSGFYIATYRKPQQALFFRYFFDDQKLKPSRRQAEDKARIDLIFSSGAPVVEEKWLGVPLAITGSDSGVLAVYNNSPAYGAREKEILTFASLQISDALERKQTEEVLRSHTTQDELTHLPNSALFRSLLNQAVARARRTKENMAVLFLDLDHFKNLRRDAGASVAQNMIRQVAERLRRNVREGDTVARWGDDRFIWLVSNMKRMDDVAILAEKMLAIVKRPIFTDGKEYSLTTSIGIGVFPFDGVESESLIRVAETALIRSKELGGATYQFYAEEVNTKVQEELSLKRQLHESLSRQEFLVHYQPVVLSESGKLYGLEALVRWHSPDGRLIFPGEFLFQSEDTGLIAPLDEWVIKTACTQVKAWDMPQLRLVVNISDYLFQQEEDLTEKIASTLEASGLPAGQLELELKESSVAVDPEQSMLKVQKLKELGVHLSIGDYGTTGLSYRYVRQFSGLKIDSSLVRDSSFAAVVSLAHGLKLRVTAKGIETEKDLALLKAERCECYQGKIFSLPVSAQECERLLRKEQPKPRVAKKKIEPDFMPWPVQAAVIDHPSTTVKIIEEVTEPRRAPEPAPVRTPEPVTIDNTPYVVSCFNCKDRFDALTAEWCSCLVSERTLLCPSCRKCFCKSPLSFKLSFWTDAPQSVWDRRIRDEKGVTDLDPNPTPDKTMRPLVLIVDDETPILRTAIKAVKSLGYDAVHAADGAQGLRLARLYIPNLILSDALMPKMDGREMCRQIKNDPLLSDIKVVIMTSLSARAKDRTGAFREFKVDDYLQKPLEYETLRSVLQKFL